MQLFKIKQIKQNHKTPKVLWETSDKHSENIVSVHGRRENYANRRICTGTAIVRKQEDT